MLNVADVPTPIGVVRIGYEGQRVAFTELMERGHHRENDAAFSKVERGPFQETSPPGQLQAYFRGERKDFDVELAFLQGTEFDRQVWYSLSKIPFGDTRTYGELARGLGRPSAARAVGGAAGRNPVPIIVPCHRLVGQDRSLTGFGMGLWRKRWLLQHEGTYPLPPKRTRTPTKGHQATLEETLRPPRARRPRSKRS